jgi:hypothetical protein
MAGNDSQQTLADYVAIAISPALIMTLVGSLVFFLVEVLLGRDCPEQLLWILFFFVFAAVLIARISMTSEIASRAGIYGCVLGLLVWLALKLYVKYPATSPLAPFDWLMNAGLIAIIWGSAHRLTWDSTLIDDSVDASGAGLLQEAGLEEARETAPMPEPEEKDRRKRDAGGLLGWIERYKRYRAETGKRPHAPGVWVVYFSLAALPLFGLGQSLIPVSEPGRRRYAFWLLVIYVASGLGLLVTTSFLNLRRYLRQRNLRMPAAMTGAWLTGGGIIIVALLVLGALIPRPSAEYPLIDLGAAFGAHDRGSSRVAQGKGQATDKGPGAEGSKEGQGEGTQKGVAKKKADGQGQDPGSNKKGGGKDGGDEAAKDGEAKKGDAKGEAKGNKEDRQDRQKEEQDGTASQPESRKEFLGDLGKKLMTLLKWLVGILIALIVLFLVLRALLRFLANFTDWAKRLLDGWQAFWVGLRRWWQRRGLPEAVMDEPELAQPPRPFAAFRDPFLTGQAGQMSPAEVVRYSYEALEAWAHERGCGRRQGETPLEFASRLAGEFPGLETAADRLVALYLGVAYARKVPAAERVEELREFWRLLVELVERPMSAA